MFFQSVFLLAETYGLRTFVDAQSSAVRVKAETSLSTKGGVDLEFV